MIWCNCFWNPFYPLLQGKIRTIILTMSCVHSHMHWVQKDSYLEHKSNSKHKKEQSTSIQEVEVRTGIVIWGVVKDERKGEICIQTDSELYHSICVCEKCTCAYVCLQAWSIYHLCAHRQASKIQNCRVTRYTQWPLPWEWGQPHMFA